MDPIKKSTTDPNAAKGMFSVVERMNAGYEKFFESKPKTSAVRSECYSNFMTCGSKSKNAPNLPAEIKTEEKTPETQPDVVQQVCERDLMTKFLPRSVTVLSSR